MIKVMQFGEGNFLRAFVDYYFESLNREGAEYSVSIVKPIAAGDLSAFSAADNKWNVVLRGFEGVTKTEIACVGEVIDPFVDARAFFALAADRELKIVVSNTTEAGICFDASDRPESFPNISYPAKLTRFLYERYCALADAGGVYIMPVELIDKNADNLFACVEKYAELWGLSDGFKKWNREKNFYCNTLVDRIVSGYPKTPEDIKAADELIGYHDSLVTVGEHFGLWAIEKKGHIEDYIKAGHHGIDVILDESIDYYKKRKVRVLNGSHTNLVAYGLLKGMQTVYDCMNDAELCGFVGDTLQEEIDPFVSDNLAETEAFAADVLTRFKNPYLNHRLISISLNSISKWTARDLPSFDDYYKARGSVPKNLTLGFSYLLALYMSVYKKDGDYFVDLPYGRERFIDTPAYLEHFIGGGTVRAFMRDKKIFGRDLTEYNGFYENVLKNLEAIVGYKGE